MVEKETIVIVGDVKGKAATWMPHGLSAIGLLTSRQSVGSSYIHTSMLLYSYNYEHTHTHIHMCEGIIASQRRGLFTASAFVSHFTIAFVRHCFCSPC